MQDIVFASNNKHKIYEVANILSEYNIISLDELGYTEDIKEYGDTFGINALIKVEAAKKYAPNKIIIGDDSGLCIDFLNGAPGVKSKRFAGENSDSNERNRIILELMKEVPLEKRNARMISAYAIYLPSDTIIIVEGTLEGQIAFSCAGENGFAYDKIFYLPEYGLTTAMLSFEEKNAISHRAKALEKVRQCITTYGKL